MTMDRRTALANCAALVVVAACHSSPQARPASRTRANLYRCEGCEGVFERPATSLSADIDMARGERGTTLIVEGQVRMPDGVTPAPGVILYLYQTNADGLYANGSSESEWSRRHGRIRGWLKTGSDGRYRVRTIKPAPYPGQNMPAHIHFTVLEPGKRPYYIDDVVFDGEFGVTAAYREQQELRGGSGIVRVGSAADGTAIVRRDIVLERHP